MLALVTHACHNPLAELIIPTVFLGREKGKLPEDFQISESLLTLRSLVNEGDLSIYFSVKTFANKIVLEPIEDSESTSDLVPLAVSWPPWSIRDTSPPAAYLIRDQPITTSHSCAVLCSPTNAIFALLPLANPKILANIMPRGVQVLDLRHSISLWNLHRKISTAVTIICWLQGFILQFADYKDLWDQRISLTYKKITIITRSRIRSWSSNSLIIGVWKFRLAVCSAAWTFTFLLTTTITRFVNLLLYCCLRNFRMIK